MKIPSVSPLQPSRTPTTSCPWSVETRTTARMTALRPGQSPPPVSTPIRIADRASDVRRIVLGELLEAFVRDEHSIHPGALQLGDVVGRRVAEIGDRELPGRDVVQQLEQDRERILVVGVVT